MKSSGNKPRQALYIWAYKNYSNSARTLSRDLKAPLIKHERSRFRGSPDKTVINWGSSQLSSEAMKCKVINSPEAVHSAANKKTFFNSHSPDLMVPWTVDKEVAREWLRDNSVIGRKSLSGHSGAGIEVIKRGTEEIEGDFPLYTKYVSKRHEYRYHFIKDLIILRQQKKKRQDIEDDDFDWKIRSYNNGFVFCVNDVAIKDAVERVALEFIEETHLDFGAIDIVYNEKRDRGYILEVNTAPALLSDTLREAYKRSFLECFS